MGWVIMFFRLFTISPISNKLLDLKAKFNSEGRLFRKVGI
jgi:hypothetical protein